MEIKFFGGNCVKISSKKCSIIVDDIAHLGQKSAVTDKDILLITDPRTATVSEKAKFVVNGPGEYEVSDASIIGIAARAHMDDENDGKVATIYRLIVDDVRIAIIGHIHPDLSDKQLEQLGTIDILCIPVGGNGYTLDGVGAQKVIREIEPRVVIPTHYDDKGLHYEVPQQDLETAIKSMAMEPSETVDSFKVKNQDVGEMTRLIIIDKK